MSNDLATTAMWDGAVRDVDAEAHIRLVARATVALAGTWPFLAAAASNEEFEHRLALMAEQIERSTPPEILGEVVANLKARFVELNTERLTGELESRTAARKIAAPEGVQSLPQAYVHVHKHSAGGDDGEYWQVDHVGSPTWMQTLGHKSDRDSALQAAREFALPNGLPLFENGRYVEGRKLPMPVAGQEIFDAKTGRWVTAATVSFRDGMPGMGNGWTADLQTNQAWDGQGWVTAENQTITPGARRVQAAQVFRPGGGQAIGLSPAQHERLNGNWGDSLNPHQAAKGPDNYSAGNSPCCGAGGHRPGKSGDFFCMDCGKTFTDRSAADASKKKGAYQPDPDAQWRYHYPDAPVAGSQGGQPTAPSPMGVGVVNQVGQTSVGPDGFPLDVAQGESERGSAAIQYQITPGQWVAPPGQWPASTMPNAATGLPEGQRRASKGSSSDGNGRPLVIPEAWKRGIAPTNWVMDDGGRPGRSVPHNDMARGVINHLSGNGSEHEQVELDDPDNPSTITITRNGEAVPWRADGGRYQAVRRTAEFTHMVRVQRDGLEPHTEFHHSAEEANAYADQHRRSGNSVQVEERNGMNAHMFASRRTATEGAAPTPGANPHYFDQGTQGLQGPAEFPANPSSAIEPKTDNRVDDFYGAVPPQVSSGTVSDGTVDGGGYTRQGVRLALRRDGTGYAVDLFAPHERFQVGWWSDRKTARAEGSSYLRAYRSRLGFSRGAAFDNEPRPGAVFHRASPTALNEAYHVQETNETDGNDSGFIAGDGGIHVHDYPRAIGELQNNWNLHDDNVAYGGDDKKRDALRRREVGKLLDSLRSAHQTKQGANTGDYQQGYEHGEAGHGEFDLVGQPSRAYSDGHADGSAARAQMHPDDLAWQDTARQASFDESGQYMTSTPQEHAMRGHYDAQMGRPYAGPEEDSEHGRAYRRGWDSFHSRARARDEEISSVHRWIDTMSPEERRQRLTGNWPVRQASTNGQIVGKCDHCGDPVRYHDEDGGHLRHLRNDSAKCRDGKIATAAIVDFGTYQARMKVSPFTTTAAADFFRAVPGAKGDCSFCGDQATHSLHQSDGSGHGMHQIGEVCNRHAKEYDERRVASKQGAVLENPTAENPTGKGADPYRAKTQWEGFETQRPRQTIEGPGGMNANTPTTAGDPIRTGPSNNSPIPGADLDKDGPRERGDQDEEDDD